jgi:hypothetical protein
MDYNNKQLGHRKRRIAGTNFDEKGGGKKGPGLSSFDRMQRRKFA